MRCRSEGLLVTSYCGERSRITSGVPLVSGMTGREIVVCLTWVG